MPSLPLTRRRFGALATLAAAMPLQAWSQSAAPAAKAYPSGPIRLVVPFPAGTGSDIAARTLGKVVSDLSGQPVVVDNKPGANGIIGVQTVLNAPADGHTILLGSNSTLASNAALFRTLPYDPIKDLAPLGLVGGAPCVVIVPPNSAIKTLAELIAQARKRPGALNYGGASPSYALYTEWMGELAHIKGNGVPYKGTNDVMTAITGGQVDYAVVDSTAASALILSGRLRALAISDDKRSAVIPDVPTSAQAGLPQFQAFSWTGLATSAKTPAATLHAAEALLQKAAASKEMRDMFARTGARPMAGSGAQMRKYQTEEIVRWKRLAQAAGLQQE